MPGFKTWAAAEVVTASNMNSYVRDQTVNVVTSGTRPGSPTEGMVIYETDTDKVLQYTTATTGWVPFWNMPWGLLGYAEVTADQTGVTSEADATSLSVAYTYVANRIVRVSAAVTMDNDTANNGSSVRIKEGGTQLKRSDLYTTVGGGGMHHAVSVKLVPTSGSHTYKLAIARLTAGTAALRAGATNPAYIMIEDLGPNAAPA